MPYICWKGINKNGRGKTNLRGLRTDTQYLVHAYFKDELTLCRRAIGSKWYVRRSKDLNEVTCPQCKKRITELQALKAERSKRTAGIRLPSQLSERERLQHGNN